MADLPDDWEDRLDEMIARAEEASRQAANARFDELTAAQTWTGETDTSCPRVPIPGECHPFYFRNGFVLDWINGLSDVAGDHLLIPKPVNLARLIAGPSDPEPWNVAQDVITLTRRVCYGLAPYVGRPFVYRWNVAVDDLGRAVATDAHIVYREGPDHA